MSKEEFEKARYLATEGYDCSHLSLPQSFNDGADFGYDYREKEALKSAAQIPLDALGETKITALNTTVKELEAQIKYIKDKYIRAACTISDTEVKIAALHSIIDEMRGALEFYNFLTYEIDKIKLVDLMVFSLKITEDRGKVASETLASIDKKLKELK